MLSRLLIALALALAALPARADSYKWIDSKGQVNYSNAPPPSALELMQLVEERISVSGADPATRNALARMEAGLLLGSCVFREGCGGKHEQQALRLRLRARRLQE